MFRKTAKKLWVFISSAVAGVCLAFGAIALPPANVAKAAIDGSLSEEVTLNKIVADADGKTAEGFEVQYKEFEMGESGNTWFMTEWTGKNAPNYAVRAVSGYSSWDGAYTKSVSGYGTVTATGIMITNSNMYQSIGVGAYRGTGTLDGGYGERCTVSATTVRKDAEGNIIYKTDAEGNIIYKTDAEGNPTNEPEPETVNVLGMRYYTANTRYIQIVGYEHVTTDPVASTTSANGALYTVYLFKVVDDGIELVANASAWNNSSWNALGGTKAVIYGNMQAIEIEALKEDTYRMDPDLNPDSVTFKYATPANSLTNLLKGVSEHYEYKDDIVTALGITDDVTNKVEAPKTETTVLTNSATLNKVQSTSGVTSMSEDIEYVQFDLGSKQSKVWFMTQFTGLNAPNYAFSEVGGRTAWNAEGDLLLTNSSEFNASYLQVFANLNAATGKAKANLPDGDCTITGQKPGLKNLAAGVEYIQIVGYDINENGTESSITCYMFTIANGKATLAGSLVPATAKGNGASSTKVSRQYAVLYGNIQCSALTTNPDSVTFSYEAPKSTLEALVMGLDNTYAYKDDIATALGYTIETVETPTYTATFEDLEGNTLKTLTEVEAVKLPSSTLADFVGWYNEADGKLYKAGEIVAVTANTTFVEVAAGIALEDGAAVRLKNDVVGMGGLRFEAVFSKAAIELLGDNVTLKGAVIPTDLLTGELALGNATAGYVALENLVEVDGEYHAYITLTNIKLENFQRKFSARAFFTVTYADGSNGTVASAYDEEKNSRSIYEVAVKAYNSGKYGEHEMLKYYLDNTVNVAVEVVDTEYTVTTEHTYDGLKADFARGYTVSEVSRDGATITFTVTLSGLTLTEDFSVTIWTDADSFETQIVTFTNGVATVNFTVAL